MDGRARCIFSLQVDRDLKSGAGGGVGLISRSLRYSVTGQ